MMGWRLGFSGTRHGMTSQQMQIVNDILNHFYVSGVEQEFHAGMCEGSDEESTQLADSIGYHTIGHPSSMHVPRGEFYDTELAAKPPLDRNKDIVDIVDYMIFTPKSMTMPRSLRGQGTWWTIKYTEGLKKPRVIIYQDGSFEEFDILGE
jgi:hypothetical protein